MRYFSATVTDNRDPEKRGRLKLKIPALHDDELPDWIDARSPLGLSSIWIPCVDDVVIVECSDGGALGGQRRWLGGTVEGQRSWPEAFRADYPNRHGIASADGAAAIVLVNQGGILVLTGPGGEILLATSENAPTEPIPLGDHLNAYLAAFSGAVSAAATTLKGAAVGPLAGFLTGLTTLETAMGALPDPSLHLSRVSKTE